MQYAGKIGISDAQKTCAGTEVKMDNTKKIYSVFTLGDMTAIYIEDTKEEVLGLTLLPASLADSFTTEGWWQAESLIQAKAVGDPSPANFSLGHSMRNSRTARNFRVKRQYVKKEGGAETVVTEFTSERLNAVHYLTHEEGAPYLLSQTELSNPTTGIQKIEYLASYSICGFSSLEEKERMEDFLLHRLQSKWSAEGKLLTNTMGELQLEPSWMRSCVQNIRYGQVGSMPVRRYFPWMVLEDKKYGWCLGSQIYHPASWQMEVYDRDDRLAVSGGLADREFGHWVKELRPGEHFTSPRALLTACVGDPDEAAYRMTCAQLKNLCAVPESEKTLPIIFNEYCTTWGRPDTENMRKIAAVLKGKGIQYCVIDAGWYAKKPGDWGNPGDWDINQELFPNGLGEATQAIRDAGMIPGLWFEMEVVGRDAVAFTENEERLLSLDGVPIQGGIRRFWDMRQPEVIEYLAEKVIGTLKAYGFGYLKVDYNDNIGIGCDGAESPGEGLRQNMAASQEFFRRIRREIPEIVIENCSSGGHRLEPSMQELVSMASFSDAHECVSIPVIAANVHRAIQPAQSQIWAVLHKDDDLKRTFYSIANTFLGRMCLSGDVYDLNEVQWSAVEEGMEFYKEAAPVIKYGKTRRYGEEPLYYNHLKGYQAVVRTQTGDQEGIPGMCGAVRPAGDLKTLAVVHTFENAPNEIIIPDAGDKKLLKIYARPNVTVTFTEDAVKITGMEDYEGIGILYRH